MLGVRGTLASIVLEIKIKRNYTNKKEKESNFKKKTYFLQKKNGRGGSPLKKDTKKNIKKITL